MSTAASGGKLTAMWRDLSTFGKVMLCLAPLLIIALIYMRVYWFETVTFSEDVGLNGEAATNPFFGFEELAKNNLEPRGGSFTKLEESVNVANYPAEKSLLMLSASRLSRMTPQRVKEIVAWVERGGNLVLESENISQEDPLLKAFGMERWRVAWRAKGFVERPIKKAGEGKDNQKDDEVDLSDAIPNVVAKQLEKAMSFGTGAVKFLWDDGEVYKVKLGNTSTLKLTVTDDTAFFVRGNVGNSIIKRQVGKGQVVAIASLGFMRRAAILKDEAGLFAMRLLEPQARPKPLTPLPPLSSLVADATAAEEVKNPNDSNADSSVNTGASLPILPTPAVDFKLPENPTLIVLGLHMEPKSLLQWLSKHGLPVLLAALALFLLWLWRIIPRFGPLAAPQIEARRNIADHWRAAGQYLLGRRDWISLLHAPRSRVLRRLRQRLGMHFVAPKITITAAAADATKNATADAPPMLEISQEQLVRLEQVCKVSAGRIHSALLAQPTTAMQLLTFMITLRQMETSLK
jgi:hypothetical protein